MPKSPANASTHLPTDLQSFRRRCCALPYTDPDYHPPTPEEVTQLIKLAGWTQAQVAALVGVTGHPQKGSTTIRKWCAPTTKKDHRQIPYAAWRLMLLNAGVIKLASARSAGG